MVMIDAALDGLWIDLLCGSAMTMQESRLHTYVYEAFFFRYLLRQPLKRAAPYILIGLYQL